MQKSPGHFKYTALSRTTTAEGTLILSPFDMSKITSGINGHLRQEFRDLEFLNAITKECFKGTLSYNAEHSL